VAVLVIGGIYYFKMPKTSNIESESETGTPKANENIDDKTPADFTPVSKDEPKATTSTTSVAADGEISKKYNASMASASKAFLAKDYKLAISYYNQAFKYRNDDTALAGLFTVYSAQEDLKNAQLTIDRAIALAPTFADYWNWKIGLLDEKTSTNYSQLKAIYNEGLTKVRSETKINLITYFAGVAERNGQIAESIATWQKAIEVHPENKTIYQNEIDRLKTLN
jgi:tetratricopeptide (TPR) repeat protein